MKLQKITWIVSAVALVVVPDAIAQGKGKGKGHDRGPSLSVKSPTPVQSKGPAVKVKGAPAGSAVSVGVTLTIGASEKSVIQGYVAGYHRGHGLPPGLAKKVAAGGDLPPGWQKKCIVGDIMPLVVFEACHPLPMEIQVKMPPPPPDTTLVAVDGRVFRVCNKTHKIHGMFIVSL